MTVEYVMQVTYTGARGYNNAYIYQNIEFHMLWFYKKSDKNNTHIPVMMWTPRSSTEAGIYR